MDEILDKLFDDYAAMAIKSEDIKMYEAEVRNNRKWLNKNLSKKQKKFLLRIEDSKDSICEISSFKSFTSGFKLGLKIGYGVNNE